MLKYATFILLLFSSALAYAQEGKRFDSLKQQLADSIRGKIASSQDDTSKIKLLINVGWLYAWAMPDTAIQYGLQARRLSRQLSFTRGEVHAATLLTEAFCTKGNFSKAMEIDLEALAVAEESGNKKLINTSFFSIANVYFYSGDYQKALDNYKKFQQNEGVSDEMILRFIGQAFFHLNQLDSALFYISKAYNLNKKNNSQFSPNTFYYLGAMDAKKGKYQEAVNNFRKGILISKNSQVGLDIVNGYTGIATLFKQTASVDSSIYYAKEAVNLAQQESLIPKLIDAAALLTELYSGKNTDSAFKYQKLMLAAKDSLFSQEKVKQLQNLSFNQQMREQEIQQAQEQLKNRLKIYALIAIAMIILLIAFTLYRSNRHKQKAYQLLQKQKQEIDRQKAKVEETLDNLKVTQSQLIQSEKMASLGELTAGIAHEIQNPLNFVNNFSEVNKELIAEMKEEIDQGNVEEVKAIANDIEENEHKINHHGKRADAIVKGMLQHSRASTGQKEPADINALADEYLRLSYHGLRAKDKDFNADFKTDFDESIGKIEVVPQDVGRVLLNLYNNAFYAVSEKKKTATLKGEKYEPTVWVTTKRISSASGAGGLEITVKDNGNGIPDKIKDKIFQPFFTTKPTGEGTGLGLSLSYDIIAKGHAGELKVETKEGLFTEFIITLPYHTVIEEQTAAV